MSALHTDCRCKYTQNSSILYSKTAKNVQDVMKLVTFSVTIARNRKKLITFANKDDIVCSKSFSI